MRNYIFIHNLFIQPKLILSLMTAPKEPSQKKEAMFYKKISDKVQCVLCPWNCMIAEGKRGVCRDRMNIKGKLYSLVYGKVCTAHLDPIEKKPLFHFLPGSKTCSIATSGCNFHCLNCQNHKISQAMPEQVPAIRMMPEEIVKAAIQNKCGSIAYTYTEPTVFYEYMYDTAKLAKTKGLRNVMVSNGYINQAPLKKLCKHLDAANIDLKVFNSEKYLRLCGGRLEPVLETILALKKQKIWIEITNLVIPGWSDDCGEIKIMCEWLVKNGLEGVPLHFSRFTPLYKLSNLCVTQVETLENARAIAGKAGMKYVYIGNVHGSEGENTHCPKCSEIVIKRLGFNADTSALAKGRCRFCKEKIAGVWK